MVRHAARRGIQVSTTTRLQVFNRRRAEECVRSGLHQLHVALDAAGTREYDFSRRGVRHERLLRHLRWLTESRKTQRSLWPRISLTAVVLRRNVAGLADVVKLAHDYGADSVAAQLLQHFVDPAGISPRHRRIQKFIDAEALTRADAELAGKHFAAAQAAARELNIGLQLPDLGGGEHSLPGACPWPWDGAYISFSGEARSCSMAARMPNLALGNMLKDGVANVWNGDAYREFRERHLAGDPPALCKDCPRTQLPRA
jgi:MoaA/NifB/PqqE/SkfB family radical SAM enzyme